MKTRTILLIALCFSSQPALAELSPNEKAAIHRCNIRLKKLPNGAARYESVRALVAKLSKLDPGKANKYFKIGLMKLAKNPQNEASVEFLKKRIIRIVSHSDLPDSMIRMIVKGIQKPETGCFCPTPTPTPVI
jgi:hypothetical protein